jgi:mono/diheme cytochrome c family protein
MRRLGVLALAAALAGCAAAPHTRAGGGVTSLRVRAVDWNAGRAPLAGVRAVADSGGVAVAFADGAATVIAGGAVVAVDRAVPRWKAAGTLPAADGTGPWIVGVDDAGRVLRLRGRSVFEPVSDRFGLAAERVLGVADAGGRWAGFLLADGVALADGAAVTRYAAAPAGVLAGGGGHLALGGAPVRVVDAATRAVHAFAVPEGERSPLVAVNAAGRVFVATPDAVYGEDARGDLRLRFESARGAVHGLAAAGARVWFADGAELGVIDGARVRETTGAGLPAHATLTGSPSGDVWTLADGALARYAVDDEPGWDDTVAPVFRRACASCHAPGGEAGLDLSTREAWEGARDRVGRRVVVERTMPPPGRAMSDADREAVRAWLGR